MLSAGRKYPVSLTYDAGRDGHSQAAGRGRKNLCGHLKVDAEEDILLAGIHFRMFISKELDEAGGTGRSAG